MGLDWVQRRKSFNRFSFVKFYDVFVLVKIDLVEFLAGTIITHEVIPEFNYIVFEIDMPIDQNILAWNKNSFKIWIKNLAVNNDFVLEIQIFYRYVNRICIIVNFSYFFRNN